MAYDYDKLYRETPNALGAPTQVFVNFFNTYDPQKARVLDVGCGQGRDALFIARLGHQVTGVDLSPHGVNDMIAAAEAEGLSVDGVVADITSFEPEGTFDVVLIDRTLHMLPEEPRLQALRRLLEHVAPEGWLLIADEASNIPGFQRVIEAQGADWRVDTQSRGHLFLQRGQG